MRKAFRASKRLIKAIAGLAVSLVVCVGMCLAWFTMNDKVDSSGASVQIEDADFVCDVKVYYLNSCYDEDEVLLEGVYEKAEDGNVYGTGKNDKLEGDKAVDKPADGELSSASDKMRPYGSVENFATAVLYEVTYTIKRDSGTYRIVATCDSDTVSVTRKPDAVDVFDSDLSNVVGYYQAGVDSGAANRFKRSEENSDIMFYKADNTKVQKLTLEGGIEYNGGKQVVSYFIMDYMDFPFVQLSNEMVQHQGTLNSRLDFAGDLHIVFERDDGEYPTFGHKHEYQYDSVGALQHKKYCACGLYETYENHTFAEGSDECTYCHYKSEHVHKFEQNKYSYNGDNTHSLQCDLCDFKQDTKISCEYTYKADGDDLTHHIKSCSACGHSENEAHTLTYTDTNDGTHHTVGCDKCDLNVSEEHDIQSDGSCSKCPYGHKGATYTYVYGASDNVGTWKESFNGTTTSEQDESGQQTSAGKIDKSHYLELTGIAGKKIVINEISGFTKDTGNAAKWILIELLDASGKTVGNIEGTIHGKKVHTFVFDTNELEVGSEFVSIRISANGSENTGGKAFAITSLSITVT